MTPESYDERIRKRKAAPIHTYWRSIEVSAMLTKTKARTSPAYQTWMRVDALLIEMAQHQPAITGNEFLGVLNAACRETGWDRTKRGRRMSDNDSRSLGWHTILRGISTALSNVEPPLRRLRLNFGARPRELLETPLDTLLARAKDVGDTSAVAAFERGDWIAEHDYLQAKRLLLRAAQDRVKEGTVMRKTPPASLHWTALLTQKEKNSLRNLHAAVPWGERDAGLWWD
jgi:hypothetical protein